MKILIGVPTFENIYPEVFKAIYDLEKPDKCEVIFEYIKGYDVSAARNKIVEKGLELEADYILMVDSDVVIPKNTLSLFLEDPMDVCLGAYAHRSKDNLYNGNTCLCRLTDENGIRYFNYPLESQYTAKELIEFEKNGQFRIVIHGGGMGCAFIKTDIFNYLDYPWYKWVNYSDKEKSVLSEDLYFCEQCRKFGFPIVMDTRIRAKHILRHAQDCV